MADVIGDYIAKQPEPQRSSLTAMRERIGGLLPRAEEAIAYGAPAWTVDGIPVVGFAASAKHWSYLPHSGQVVATMGDALAAYETSKGAIKVPADQVLNKPLLKKLITTRLAEVAMVPDSKGKARDFYADGGLKAKGGMKDGELHGAWQWWRQDGSLLRSGTFDRGRQVREWTTYDRDGNVVSVKDLGR
ncbi:MAG: DUF1801 domain-containing protein [Candidatus Nanopelagicales bacterium]